MPHPRARRDFRERGHPVSALVVPGPVGARLRTDRLRAGVRGERAFDDHVVLGVEVRQPMVAVLDAHLDVGAQSPEFLFDANGARLRDFRPRFRFPERGAERTACSVGDGVEDDAPSASRELRGELHADSWRRRA